MTIGVVGRQYKSLLTFVDFLFCFHFDSLLIGFGIRLSCVNAKFDPVGHPQHQICMVDDDKVEGGGDEMRYEE